MKPLKFNSISPGGITGELARGITKNWLIGLRETNPAIIDMFAERDKLPYRDMLPWSGEFAGKYITGAYYTYMLTRDEELRAYIEKFIAELLCFQDADGYLGCYSKECHLTGAFSTDPSSSGGTWDSWSHYHLMYGLWKWYSVNGDTSYMEAIRKIALLYSEKFFNKRSGNRRLVDIGSSEMNLAPYHIFALLAAETGDSLYLDLAREIEKDISDERAGDYITCAENGIEYHQCPKPRWESMHDIMGIAEMYRAIGEKRYLDDALQIYESILRTDIHNTGAFSTNEQAVGSPFREGSIETCCVVAYNALASLLYGFTGRADIIDFLELAHYNAVLGYYNPTGYWSTYNTPMEGTKIANFHHINFQSRPGSPNLNCCSVNAPRGVAEISDWMLAEQDGRVYINNFESLKAESDGLKISIESPYPAPGDIVVALESDRPVGIALRVPAWSKKSSLTLNGEPVEVKPGEYSILPARVWKGDRLLLRLDFSVRFLEGGELYEGKRSIYYGPLLFGVDTSLIDKYSVSELPALSESELSSVLPAWREDGRITVKLSDGVTLGDFRTLGVTGSYYKTFFAVTK